MTFPWLSRTPLMRATLSGALLLAHSPQARAQTTPAPVAVAAPAPSKPTAENAQKFLALFKMQRLCKTPLDLNVQNASLEDIAARVRKTLPQPAAPIEVRGALPMRLTFELKQSTVGASLRAAGALAGVKLWVFFDHLLLAPETAISPEERDALKAETASEEPEIGVVNRQFSKEDTKRTRIFSAMVVEEIKARCLQANTSIATGKTEPTLQITFGQLSPDAQMMLQELVHKNNDYFAQSQDTSLSGNPPFTISPQSVIALNPLMPNGQSFDSEDSLLLSNGKDENGWPSNRMGWPLAGAGINRGWSSPTPDKPNSSPTAPPFLDPSAGKS